VKSEDFLLVLLGVLIVFSAAISVYLWHFKQHRSSRILHIAYFVRLICSTFFFYSAYWVHQILEKDFPFASIAVLSGPFGLIGILLALPYGFLFKLKSRAASH
jgi:hypothetical protein